MVVAPCRTGRAAFPRVEIRATGTTLETLAEHHYLVWDLTYADGGRVKLCKRCPRPPYDHIIAFRLGHPPATVVAHGSAWDVETMAAMDATEVVASGVHPPMRYGSLEAEPADDDDSDEPGVRRFKVSAGCNSHFHGNKRFRLTVTLVETDEGGKVLRTSVCSSPMIKIVSKFLGKKKKKSSSANNSARSSKKEGTGSGKSATEASSVNIDAARKRDAAAAELTVEERIAKIPKLAVGTSVPSGFSATPPLVPMTPFDASGSTMMGGRGTIPGLTPRMTPGSSGSSGMSKTATPGSVCLPLDASIDSIAAMPAGSLLLQGISLFSPAKSPVSFPSMNSAMSTLQSFLDNSSSSFDVNRPAAQLPRTSNPSDPQSLFEALGPYNIDAPISQQALPSLFSGADRTVENGVSDLGSSPAPRAPPGAVPGGSEVATSVDRILSCAQLFHTLSSSAQRKFLRTICASFPEYTLVEEDPVHSVVCIESTPSTPTSAAPTPASAAPLTAAGGIAPNSAFGEPVSASTSAPAAVPASSKPRSSQPTTA
ncbi:uncharacterized protein AMSG_04106 [Thecamonas trahens ATCC 50062]|uniref:Uncharacterized protein n=1 Tax=Thecamonas trahens ATCC 50062 TaxID=461836 RepID=A0A0L0D6Z8_THETB|nr:hypothetical protein AMSG_04106 [Thecamonas trahens ATCC 50062]KNC47876.1 hypothetical protein AMSG_04106 [Thecamonas trahens ATCC 50062]|eukprot:XP_013759354.1 hypothetical protein AMSG_04106 [Thecamonas trahens ATCC 50062]